MKIGKDEFKKMTKKYQDKHPGTTRSVTQKKEDIQAILNYPGVTQVATYFAQNDDGTNTVIFVGLDANNKVLYDTATDRGNQCPPFCPDE